MPDHACSSKEAGIGLLLPGICQRQLKSPTGEVVKETGVSVNPGKTEQIMFTNRRKLHDPPRHLFSGNFRLKSCAKYLGGSLDLKLNWGPHLVAAQKATLWKTK